MSSSMGVIASEAAPRMFYLSGSSTSLLLEEIRAVVTAVYSSNWRSFGSSHAARAGCLTTSHCVIDDDLSRALAQLRGRHVRPWSPVYFNNVSSQMKVFIDWTWSLRGQLRNRIANESGDIFNDELAELQHRSGGRNEHR